MPPPDFQRYQREFAAHIRDPRANARPAGVPARRMGVYNELVLANVRGFLDACFPVLRETLGETRWRRLARRFLANHRCTSPLFRDIPREFAQWLAGTATGAGFPVYAPHLAHYEWVELALDTAPEGVHVEDAGHDDLLGGRPVLNPVSMLLEYPYPVHRIGPGFRPRPTQAEQTFILAFRNAADQVRFIVLNPVSARLLALLAPGRSTGRGALQRIARELRHADPGTVIAGGLNTLQTLRAEGAIIGARRPRSGRVNPSRQGSPDPDISPGWPRR
ncbi:MAG: putative DNA-binding domain-containing protein [Betaproteobacteria bacterium]